jgi:hypothetical protein
LHAFSFDGVLVPALPMPKSSVTAEEYSERYKELKETSTIAAMPMRQIEKIN